MLPTDTELPFPWSPLTRKTLNGVNDRDLAYNGGFFLSFFLSFFGGGREVRSFEIPSSQNLSSFPAVYSFIYFFRHGRGIGKVEDNRLYVRDDRRLICLYISLIEEEIFKFFEKFKMHKDFTKKIPSFESPTSLDNPQNMKIRNLKKERKKEIPRTFNLELSFQRRRAYKQE